jgi:hypothetical protein
MNIDLQVPANLYAFIDPKVLSADLQVKIGQACPFGTIYFK